MKKTMIILALSGFCVLGSVFAVNAQDFTGQLDDAQSTAGFVQTDLSVMIGGLIGAALSILGVILLLLMIYAGFLWMTAGGEKDKTKKAKEYMINAVIGLIIILTAYAITNFVIDAIQGAM